MSGKRAAIACLLKESHQSPLTWLPVDGIAPWRRQNQATWRLPVTTLAQFIKRGGMGQRYNSLTIHVAISPFPLLILVTKLGNDT